MNPLHVCIVGLKCYDHVAQKPVPRYIGGIETQLTILAKGLTRQGCRVSLITYDHGQSDGETFDGVTVLKSYAPETGIRGLRVIARITRLWAAMRRADADVYLQMGAGIETGYVALGCRMISPRRRFVFCLSSNADFGLYLRAGRFGWEGRLYSVGLRRADVIFSQTENQRKGLRKMLGLESLVIPMAITEPTRPGSTGRQLCGNVEPATERNRILWIGRITVEKRLEWILEAAAKCPEFRFEIVGTPNRESDYATNLSQSAARLPNVTVHGRISNTDLASLYHQTLLLCCTSRLEGFPTSFLEAWSLGIPVVTTFDPDEIVARYGLGVVVETQDDLIAALCYLMQDKGQHETFSGAARRYYLENHIVETVSHRFKQELEQVRPAPCAITPVPSPT